MVDRPEASYEYSYYTIIPDGWKYDQVTASKKYTYIVDSGTTLCYLPSSMCALLPSLFLLRRQSLVILVCVSCSFSAALLPYTQMLAFLLVSVHTC